MKVGSHHCSIFTYLHYRTVRIFSTIKIIDEYHFQFSFYAWKFSSYCSAEMFAIFVRLEKAKVGTRFRGYPPTKLLFFIMTRSDNLLGCSTSLSFSICEFANLCICILQSQLSSFTSLNPLQISQFVGILSGGNTYFHLPIAVSRDIYRYYLSMNFE